jgi:hypothetical protein
MRRTVSSDARRPAHRRPRPGARCVAAVLGALALAALAAPAASAASGCITRLPGNVSLPDGLVAAAYTNDIRVRINSGSILIRNLRAELYTFSGRRMGVSTMRRFARGPATLRLRLEASFRPMQIGGFTLVLTGEPNASPSCGPKKTTRVVKFRGCRERLPLTFPSPPGGNAADYEGFLSVPVRSRGPLIRSLTSRIFSFDGLLLGNATELPALFGETTLDHALLRPLTPGSYTVIVEGWLDEQPRSCGRKSAQTTMTFR